jgi:hypothetical protein
MVNKILEDFSNYQKNGSGWRLKSVESLIIHIVELKVLTGSSYSELPPRIKKKKAIINMKNDDNGPSLDS